MATFEQSAAVSAAAAAVSADTATKAAEAVLKKFGEFKALVEDVKSSVLETLRKEMESREDGIRKDFQKADSDISGRVKAIEDDYVKSDDYATATKAGLTKIGDYLEVDAAGRVSVRVATSSTLGVMRPGKCMSVVNGVLTFSLDGYRGGVDIALADGSAAIALSAGLVDMVATQKVRAKVSAGCQSELNVKSNGLSYLATRSGTGYNLFSVDVGTSYDGVNVGNAAFALYMRGSNV